MCARHQNNKHFDFPLGFLLVLRCHGGLSHRGPLITLVFWIALALLSCIWLRSSVIKSQNETSHNYTNDAILVGLHSLYFMTLLFKGSSTYVQRRTIEPTVSFLIFHELQLESLNILLNRRIGTTKSSWYALRSIS